MHHRCEFDLNFLSARSLPTSPSPQAATLSWIHTQMQVFLSLCRMRISIFWGQEHLTDWWISKRYPKSDIASWVEKVQLQERFTLVTQDSIGHLKTFCMSVLSLSMAFESQWKCYSSSQSYKMLAFEYEFSFILQVMTNYGKKDTNNNVKNEEV